MFVLKLFRTSASRIAASLIVFVVFASRADAQLQVDEIEQISRLYLDEFLADAEGGLPSDYLCLTRRFTIRTTSEANVKEVDHIRFYLKANADKGSSFIEGQIISKDRETSEPVWAIRYALPEKRHHHLVRASGKIIGDRVQDPDDDGTFARQGHLVSRFPFLAGMTPYVSEGARLPQNYWRDLSASLTQLTAKRVSGHEVDASYDAFDDRAQIRLRFDEQQGNRPVQLVSLGAREDTKDGLGPEDSRPLRSETVSRWAEFKSDPSESDASWVPIEYRKSVRSPHSDVVEEHHVTMQWCALPADFDVSVPERKGTGMPAETSCFRQIEKLLDENLSEPFDKRFLYFQKNPRAHVIVHRK